MRNLILSALIASTGLFALQAQAEPIQAGKQYVELNSAVPVAVPGKVEVVELFWYGCPHCYQFESTINPWAEQLPEDVNFVRIPAMFGGLWNLHGQAFLTLESMKVEHRVHSAVFDAMHKQGKKLTTLEEFADFVATQGVDRATFLKTFNSFAVKSQVEKAKKLAKAYQITGVPVLVVGGKYRFDIGSSGGMAQTLKVADHLIDHAEAWTLSARQVASLRWFAKAVDAHARVLLSSDPATRYETIQWVMWQMGGVGPMFGQLGFFHKFAGKDYEDKRPRDRYVAESKRLLKVLDERLAGRQWVMGDQYTIADIAILPWVRNLVGFYGAGDLVEFDQFKEVQRVLAAFVARPAVARGLAIPARG